MMRVVIAPDSFKGVLDAASVAQSIAEGVLRACPDALLDLVPMADGGEGTLDCVLKGTPGNLRKVAAHGPLGESLDVPVGLINRASTAVIEMALAAGHAQVPATKRDPLLTSTFGVGEVVRAACSADIDEIIVAAGGSATVDGGAGMIQALGLTLIDRAGKQIPAPIGGGRLHEVSRLIWTDAPSNLEDIRFTVACDVLNPLCGPNGAAEIFAPQKGADPPTVELLARGLESWADVLERFCGRSIRHEPGMGAAGGVAGPLVALCRAQIVPGVDYVSELNGLRDKIGRATLVITGEGRLDAQSLMGKVVGAVGRMARSADVPCIALVGEAGPGSEACLGTLNGILALNAPLEETSSRLAVLAADAMRAYCQSI